MEKIRAVYNPKSKSISFGDIINSHSCIIYHKSDNQTEYEFKLKTSNKIKDRYNFPLEIEYETSKPYEWLMNVDICDVCGHKKYGLWYALYDEKYNEVPVLKQCADCVKFI